MSDKLSLICIPMVFPNITVERIYHTLVEQLGMMSIIHIELEENENEMTGKKFNTAYIFVEEWFDKVVKEKLILGEQVQIIYEPPKPWHWWLRAVVEKPYVNIVNAPPPPSEEAQVNMQLKQLEWQRFVEEKGLDPDMEPGETEEDFLIEIERLHRGEHELEDDMEEVLDYIEKEQTSFVYDQDFPALTAH